ncbi:MAG TPA: hypothetical protein VJ831_12645 [Jatrophihabitantaceae bacterium]|nr:hypothetical protein [Jatrophihabitantaceae bacterium]
MGTLLDNPKKVYPVLVVLIVGLFALSAVGQGKGDSLSWVGAIGWFGFLITLLVTIVYSISLLFRRRRRTSAA